MPAAWTDEELKAARQRGDPAADNLVKDLLDRAPDAPSFSRGAYNAFLELADLILDSPELVLVRDSDLRRHLKGVPQEFLDFFAPMPVPDWVDPEKLRVAARLWRDNAFLFIILLYARSLPECYLARNGIPALYFTRKLRDPKYFTQRLYETGLFLDSVMDPAGLKIVPDNSGARNALNEAIDALDAHWDPGRGILQLKTAASAAGPNPVPDIGAVQRKLGEFAPKRYLWGAGFLAARKVRLLHASMRYMLLNPSRRTIGQADAEGKFESLPQAMSHHASPWDSPNLGVPVNQEDLAYTLLTFGYSLPAGANQWGLQLTLEEKESFLHLWKLIGAVIGIEPQFLTDRWDEAEALFHQIQRMEAGPSSDGQVLTEAVINWLKDYLPHHFQAGERIGASLIRDHLGDNASMILPPASLNAIRGPIFFFNRAIFRTFIVVHHLFQRGVFRRIPVISPFIRETLHQASEQLIESWRAALARRPFFVPQGPSVWKLQRGATEQFQARLAAWRQRVFNAVAGGIACLILAKAGLLLSLLFWILHMLTPLKASLGALAIGFLGCVGALRWHLPRLLKSRPEPSRSLIQPSP